MYEKILVATDGSEGAERAVQTALDIAEADEAELHALYVVDTTRFAEPALSTAELATEEVESYGSDLVDAVKRRGEDRGLTAVGRTCHGKIWEEITAYAADVDAGLIVLGTRGRGGVRPPRIGRVATRVVQSTDIPTLIV